MFSRSTRAARPVVASFRLCGGTTARGLVKRHAATSLLYNPNGRGENWSRSLPLLSTAYYSTGDGQMAIDETKASDVDDGDLSVLGPPSTLPKEVVNELNRFIVGQDDAKKAVAVALRNRWRRRQLPEDIRGEIVPKNILMIGPTGVGKTEIARRLANLANAPFVKVEATKFTEVGFHGRDVDQIIRDLVDNAIKQTRSLLVERHKDRIQEEVNEELLNLLTGQDVSNAQIHVDKALNLEIQQSRGETRKAFGDLLKNGDLEDREIELDNSFLQDKGRTMMPQGSTGNPSQDLSDLLKSISNLKPAGGQHKVRMTVKKARPYLTRHVADRMYTNEMVVKEAVESTEENGIVFIDEIDKICTSRDSAARGVDASSEGVQRDLLPLIEGSVVGTKYGNIDTSKILFIASGAFYRCKPSDLLAELQGRLPIRVELHPLKVDDLHRILTEPEFNLISQQVALLKTEDIQLNFTDDAIRKMAEMAAEVNRTIENIGARRLHTVVEKIIEEVSFNCEDHAGKEVVVDEKFVEDRLKPMLVKTDLQKFVL